MHYRRENWNSVDFIDSPVCGFLCWDPNSLNSRGNSSFHGHMTEILKCACSIEAAVYPMLSYHNHLAMHTQFTINLLFLRSVIIYFAPAFLINKQPWALAILDDLPPIIIQHPH